MTDLLTPDEVKDIADGGGGWEHACGWVYSDKTVTRLCRDYLTLWGERDRLESQRDVLVDRNKELEALIPKRLIQRVGGTETDD